MKKEYGIYKVSLVTAAAFFVLGGCSHQFSVPIGPATSGSGAGPAAGNLSATQADNRLAANLYNFYQNQSGNIFFSPFSIITAMAMAQEGANGPTATQMQTVLGLSSDAAVRQQGFQQLIGKINAPGKSYTLDTADNLWVQQGFNLLSPYINVCQNDYYAGVTNVDFIGNPGGAANTINAAVSQETEGLIPSLLSPSSLSPNTRLVLTNAIYFKADWQNQFDTSLTYAQPFYATSSSTESVSMMHQTISAVVGNYNGAASVLAVPYKSGEASMYLFLPPQGGMAALEGSLSGSNLNAWLAANASSLAAGGSGSAQVALALPKFTFSTSYDLTSTFQSLGMPLAFTQPGANGTGADFSGIDGAKDLFISDVIHKAYIHLTETGTTAAGATAVIILSGNSYSFAPTPIPFTVDHPFIFMIVENTTNTVLFMGRVDDPLSNS